MNHDMPAMDAGRFIPSLAGWCMFTGDTSSGLRLSVGIEKYNSYTKTRHEVALAPDVPALDGLHYLSIWARKWERRRDA